MKSLHLLLSSLLMSVVVHSALASCETAGFVGGFAPLTTISNNGQTPFDVTLASSSYNYTLYPGNPSVWGNLLPGGFVEYTVFTASPGTYNLQIYYAAPGQGVSANLSVNGVQQAPLALPGTGSWGTLQMSGLTPIALPAGLSFLRVAASPIFQPFNLSGILVTTTPQAAINVNSLGTTNLDITAASGANQFVLYPGNPSLWGNLQPGGYVEYTLNVPAAGSYALQATFSTTLGGGASVLVNGVQQQSLSFYNTGSWQAFATSAPVLLQLSAGVSTLRLAALREFEPFNLSGLALVAGSSSTPAGYPLAGQNFYVNQYSLAAQNIGQSCSAFYSDGANLLQKIASQPQGVWFGNWNTNIQGDTANVISLAAQQHATPIMVAYDIPNRDCSGYSSGGALDANAYRSWISGFAAGIGQAKAVVILEPDALLQLTNSGCLNTAQQTERLSLLNYAVSTLQQTAVNASVYIDAGRAGEYAVAPTDMAQRLSSAGIANAAGFALNVSNYIATDMTSAYGQQISTLVGNKHFIIDTSRNGLGSAGDLNWCNPLNRGLGAPSQGFSSGAVDGYVWGQNPGTSDGSCNGAPPAGQFSLQIACTLSKNAIF